MITTPRSLFVLALLSGLSAAAFAQSDRVDRAQLRAQTAAAVAAGQIPRGELSLADLQAAVPASSTLTRAEVRVQTLLAMARGEIAYGESGPSVAPFSPVKTRAEVNAETRMSMRLQLIPRGEAPAREATAHELELIRLAGERARHALHNVAAR